MRKVILNVVIPLLFFISSLASFIQYEGGNIYWPAAGLWALALAVTTPRCLASAPVPAAAAGLMLLAPHLVAIIDVSAAPDVQFVLLPAVTFLLAYLTLSFLLPALSALLSTAFIGVSALAFYYLDRIAGTSFIPTNEAFMLHITAGLIGAFIMYLVFYAGLRMEARA
mgnify:CR=1 FL=1